MNIVHQFLRNNPEIQANIKDEKGLINHLATMYLERGNELVNSKTSIAEDIETAIKVHGRPYLKVLGSGKFVPKFTDGRTESEKKNQQNTTTKLLKEWVEKRGFVFRHPEALDLWLQSVSLNSLPVDDGTGKGFSLAVLINGQKVKTYKPEELFQMVSPYVDQAASHVSDLRIKAKIRQEALLLSGMTHEDLKSDPKNRERLKDYEEMIKAESLSQPVKTKVPETNIAELKADLRRRGAWEANLPSMDELHSLQERMRLDAYVTSALEEAEKKPFSLFQKIVQRPEVYQQQFEKYEGLDYGPTTVQL